jgi:hypothetical protein
MPPLPVAIAAHASFVYGGYLYVAGGLSGGPDNLTEEKRVWRAPIDGTHTLGAWEAVSSLPVARGHVHQLPVVADRVYSVAGALDLDLNSTDEIDVGVFK